jgi:serine/threonine protein phosphatase PrpC
MEKAALMARGTQFGGSTATMAFVRTDLRPSTGEPRARLILANVGDSRTALFRPDVDSHLYIPAFETRYHDVSQSDETSRMIAAGSRVEHKRLVWDEGKHRVSTAMTRALGYDGKGGVIAAPEVYVMDAYASDVVVLASDGFWETMSGKDVCDVLNKYLPDVGAIVGANMRELSAALMNQLMVQRALASSTRKWDNATVIVAHIVSQ